MNREIKLCYILTNMSIKDKILMKIFKNYTYKVLENGIKYGFNWNRDIK